MKLALELLNEEVSRLNLDISNTGDATGIYTRKLKDTLSAIVELEKIIKETKWKTLRLQI